MLLYPTRLKSGHGGRDSDIRLSLIHIWFVILLGAGLSTQRAWTKITDDYLEKRKGLEGTIQPIYEEMQIASLQMQNGTSPKAVSYTHLDVYKRQFLH